MIVAHDLTKKFGTHSAIDGVSFSVSPGEFVFLTGPSGSGKTTLIRLIIRDIKADSGTLNIDGKDISKLKSKDLPIFRRNIGTVFQDFKLLSDLTVEENVSIPLEVKGVKPADIKTAINLSLDMVGLSGKSKLFPAQLSGGELQRVGLARAIVGKPKILLADEPTGNLDPKTAQSIVKLIKEIHGHLKTTVIMATHNSDIVNHYHQRVISLNDGKIAKDSPQGKYEE